MKSWLLPGLMACCIACSGAKKDDGPLVVTSQATRVPRFEDSRLREFGYRFIADRNDLLKEGDAFFPAADLAKTCALAGLAYERLFFGSTRAEWAKTGTALTNVSIAVLDGECSGNILTGPASVLVRYGYSDNRHGGPTQTRWMVGEFDATGMTSGVAYSASNDPVAPGEYAITYFVDPARKLHFAFTRETLHTVLDQQLGPAQVERTAYDGDHKRAVVNLLADNTRHGLATTWDESGQAGVACYVLGEEVDRERCDGTAVALSDEEQAKLDARIAAWAAPPAMVSAIASSAWPELPGLMRPVGGGENDAAVIVGIEDYAFVSDVPGAAQNARDWYLYLTKSRGVAPARVRLLLNADATDGGMRDAVMNAATQVQAGGTLWFVFVGHGAPAQNQKDGLLVGVDAQQTARGLYGRSVAQRELIELAAAGPQAQAVLVVDACFSGQTASGALAPGLQPMIAVSTQISDARVLVFSAGGSDQFAGPLPLADRPAFSYLVLGGLLGWADASGDGVVDSRELIGFTQQTLAAVLVDRAQTPQLAPDRVSSIGVSAGATAPDVTQIVLQR